VKTSVNLRVHVAVIGVLMVLWFAVILAVVLFGNEGMSGLGLAIVYIPPFQAIEVVLPVVLLVLGIDLTANQSYQRTQHPLLFYSGVTASALPFAVLITWIAWLGCSSH